MIFETLHEIALVSGDYHDCHGNYIIDLLAPPHRGGELVISIFRDGPSIILSQIPSPDGGSTVL